MKQKQWLQLGLLLLGAVWFLLPLSAEAATQTELNNQAKQLQGMEEVYKWTQDEVKNYRDHLQKETENFNTAITALATLMSVGVAIFSLIITWNITSSRKELRSEIREIKADSEKKVQETNERSQNRLAEIHKEGEEKLTKIQAEIHKEGEEKLAQIQAEQKAELQKIYEDYHRQTEQIYQQLAAEIRQMTEEKMAALRKLIDAEQVFTSTRILWIGTEAALARLQEQEIKAFEKRGLNNMKTLVDQPETVENHLHNTEYDLIIYHNENESSGWRAVDIANWLRKNERTQPFIVYTYQGSWLHKTQQKPKLDRYLWALTANNPTSLASYLFSLAHAFHQREPSSDGGGREDA